MFRKIFSVSAVISVFSPLMALAIQPGASRLEESAAVQNVPSQYCVRSVQGFSGSRAEKARAIEGEAVCQADAMHGRTFREIADWRDFGPESTIERVNPGFVSSSSTVKAAQ